MGNKNILAKNRRQYSSVQEKREALNKVWKDPDEKILKPVLDSL